ncbi:MAG TPA: SURF1 family protein [Actinomycetaceae bacterium]|nr:SURF1 family protein [Actinomycetaceae bacterium]
MTEFEERTFRSQYAFVASSRWLGLIAFALIAAVVCVFLGRWQWGRYEEKAARLERIDANWDAPVMSIDDVLTRGLAVTEADEWRRVELTGEYLTGGASIRNRPVQSRPALLPTGMFFAERDDAGSIAVVVNRGWLPADEPIPAVPGGPQVIEVRLRLEEPPAGRDAPEMQAYNFNASEIVSAVGLAGELEAVPVLQGWAQVTTAEPPLGVLPDPDRTLGNHLSYAFQWWFFAAAIPVGVVILARREARDEFAIAVAGIGVPRPGAGPRDEDIEDQLIEEQLMEEQLVRDRLVQDRLP